jgi:hypothetical protein
VKAQQNLTSTKFFLFSFNAIADFGLSSLGPGFFLSPKGKGPHRNAVTIGMTRIAATFTPSFMNGKSWWTHLLHSTSYGVKAMNAL